MVLPAEHCLSHKLKYTAAMHTKEHVVSSSGGCASCDIVQCIEDLDSVHAQTTKTQQESLYE